jgi:hypothetical protein
VDQRSELSANGSMTTSASIRVSFFVIRGERRVVIARMRPSVALWKYPSYSRRTALATLAWK